MTNPKRAAYNHIYHKTTVSIDKAINNNKNKEIYKISNQDLPINALKNKCKYLILLLLLLMFVFIFIIQFQNNTVYNDKAVGTNSLIVGNESEIKKENDTKTTTNPLEIESVNETKKEKNYMTEFLYSTETKQFLKIETENKFKNMMQKCNLKSIYDIIFSQDLKNKITLEQFINYNINAYGIERIEANQLADESISISFYDIVNSKSYLVTIKNRLITQFIQI